MADRTAPEQTIYAKAVAHSCSNANTQGQNSLILDINMKLVILLMGRCSVCRHL